MTSPTECTVHKVPLPGTSDRVASRASRELYSYAGVTKRAGWDGRGGMSEREKVLSEALRECLRFLVIEQHWESFRADMLYPDHDPKHRASEENARQLANFLAQPQIKQYVKELLA